MFEEPTVDVSVVDTQPVKRLSREATGDALGGRHGWVRSGSPGVLRLSGDEARASSDEPVRVALARHVHALQSANSASMAHAVAERAVTFLFGDGLQLEERDRRVLGAELTRTRRRWTGVHRA